MGIALGQGHCLGAVHDVVRHCRHPLGELGRGANGAEGVETHAAGPG